MNPVRALTAGLARVGDWADAATRAARATPATVRTAMTERRPRYAALGTGFLVLVLYLLSIGDIAISTSGRWADVPTARWALGGLFEARAPYVFEPVLELHPGAHVALFFSPVNTLLGAVVAMLAAANIALAVHSAQVSATCRRRGYGRVLTVLPAFLLGFACCVPTFVLALGASTAAGVLPVLLPLRAYFYPFAVVLLLASLVFGTARLLSAPTRLGGRANGRHVPTER